jgi:hypothetical protein
MPETILLSNEKSNAPHPLRDLTNSHSHPTPANETGRKLASTEQSMGVDGRNSKGIFQSYVYRDEIEILNLENMIGTPVLSDHEESDGADDGSSSEETGEGDEELEGTHHQNRTVGQEIDLLAEHDFAQSLRLRDSIDVTILRGLPRPTGSHIRFDD